MDNNPKQLADEIEWTRQRLYQGKTKGSRVVISRRLDAQVIRYHRMTCPAVLPENMPGWRAVDMMFPIQETIGRH